MPISIKITTDCKIIEVSEEQENEGQKEPLYDCCPLHVPQHWKFNTYILTMTFPDIFEDSDKFNPIATLIYRYLKNHTIIIDDIICGTVYVYPMKRLTTL